MVLDGYKTYLAAIAAVLIAVGAAIQQFTMGQKIEYQLVVEAVIALAMIFLRSGIKKAGC